jgi:hypothetical protein
MTQMAQIKMIFSSWRICGLAVYFTTAAAGVERLAAMGH